mmetsp:Transcript_57490/g.178474  ORF Transcript_57490/g.178474 Transcript_57490/m.178474 type:complete len:404 (-) Transcript_57490:175-1386(-)
MVDVPRHDLSEGKEKGVVQRMFSAGQEGLPFEEVFGQMTDVHGFKEQFGAALERATPEQRKLLAVRSLLPFAKLQLSQPPEQEDGKQGVIPEGVLDLAESRGVPWRAEVKRLQDRGLEAWQEELRAVTRPDLRVPEYYAVHGQQNGPHGFRSGNCCWAAAFSALPAYLFVHLHHFPELPPQACFDELHGTLGHAAIRALGKTASAASAPLHCVDLGCGVGTSTFSTKNAFEAHGLASKVTGVDLSGHFVAVARHLQRERGVTRGLRFLHGDALDLRPLGFEDASLDLITASELTHELPLHASQRLFREAARALRPGGVLAFMDLNSVQILKTNPVANLVRRIATYDEPYLDQYLEMDIDEVLKASGLEVVERLWPNCQRYKDPNSECSLRIVIASRAAQQSAL